MTDDTMTMNSPKIFLAFLALTAAITPLAAQTQPTEIKVAALRGTAVSETIGSRATPVEPGTSLPRGTTLRTGPRSALDLFLGNVAGTLRLTQNTTITITQFETTETNTTAIEFHLTTGSVLGLGNRMDLSNPYLIKVPSGILDTHARQFRADAKGLVVCLDGSLVFAHMPEGGSPKLHPMNCPPPLYFWPADGVKLAPPVLVREVQGQINARLPSK